MQICAVILYGKNGKKRILPFELGKVNIITGKSKTGKSVIGDIIDYCFGGSYCNIAEGFVRERVAWYGLHLVINDEYILIARQNPPNGQSSTNKCCYIIGATEIPGDLSNATPIDNEGLEKILSAKLGISENIFIPPIGQTRKPLMANIRHTLYYCIQGQSEIASKDILFHRQSEPYMEYAIRDTLPYFLGIIKENALALKSELTQLKRKAKIIRRSIEEVELIKGNGLEKAIQLIAEAKEVGLLEQKSIDLTDYNDVKQELIKACKWEPIEITFSGMDKISFLQSELQSVQQALEEISIDIRNTEEFLRQVRGYNTEIEHQRNRLESIGLFDQLEFDSNYCPLCSKKLTTPSPSADEMRQAINKLSAELSSVSRERPHLRKHIDGQMEVRQKLREKANALKLEINALYKENEEAAKLKDLNARRARIVGRISLWLESVIISDELEIKKTTLKDLETRILEINSILDETRLEERRQSVINRISSMMSGWAKDLELEHSEYPYRFDLKKLTVMVDQDRPVPLQQLGSASNWLGCHLITLFSFHSFFRSQNRPVPAFLFLDQPSQVYFPSETEHRDVDSQEIRVIYEFIFNRVQELYPDMQVIIVDHADIKEDYFQEAVVEKWWDGTKLVPPDW